MSWAEDNGIDCWDMDDFYEGIEENWDKGIHIDQNGKKWKIKNLKDSHLLNIINYFQNDLNVKKLLKEAKKRKLL